MLVYHMSVLVVTIANFKDLAQNDNRIPTAVSLIGLC